MREKLGIILLMLQPAYLAHLLSEDSLRFVSKAPVLEHLLLAVGSGALAFGALALAWGIMRGHRWAKIGTCMTPMFWVLCFSGGLGDGSPDAWFAFVVSAIAAVTLVGVTWDFDAARA